MRSHLFFLHPSMWEIVENGMHFDSTDNPMIINEQIHKNAQATTMLLASLCREEYNKVSGLDNAKHQDGTSGRRAGEVHDDQGRGANINLQQAQDPGQ
jgi:hypothetical protein